MENPFPPNNPPTKRGFEKLKEEYNKDISKKLQLLKNCIEDLQQPNHQDKLKKLRIEVHKIAGTAGSFGFSQVSETCKEMEKYLIQKINEQPSSRENSGWITELESYLNNIQKGFSHPDDENQ